MTITTHVAKLTTRSDNGMLPAIDCGDGLSLCPEGQILWRGQCVEQCGEHQMRDINTGWCINCTLKSVERSATSNNSLCLHVTVWEVADHNYGIEGWIYWDWDNDQTPSGREAYVLGQTDYHHVYQNTGVYRVRIVIWDRCMTEPTGDFVSGEFTIYVDS